MKKLLESIQIQSYKNFEIIINDNSPDDSVFTLLNSYGSLPIHYEKNIPVVSAVENCVTTMRRANGKWIKVMHDDDWFATPDALQQFSDTAISSGKDFIFCACNQVYLEENKIVPEELNDEKKQMLEESIFSLFYLNIIGHPSVVMHKKDIAIEYDPQFNWVVDIDYYMRYLHAHQGFYYIDKKLVNIGKGSTQESSRYYKNPMVEIPEYFTLLAKYKRNLAVTNLPVFHLLWNMVTRYRIKNIAQINSLGYTGQIPDKLEEIIAYQKKIPRIILKQPRWSKVWMMKCYRKITQDLYK